jgi:GTP pyrophosphokinase
LAHHFSFDKVDDFLAAIGRSDVNTSHVVNAINESIESTKPDQDEEWQIPTPSRTTATATPSDMRIQGVGNLMTTLAQCCRPVPGDNNIIGYITRGRGVTIHRRDCPNVLRFDDERRERLIEVDWDVTGDKTYPVDVQIEAFDRPGLLRDITALVANEKINLSTVNVTTKKKDHTATVFATLEIANIDQLSRVLALIEQLPNVLRAQRRK